MMSSVTHPLAGALVQPLRIKYYIDGWNSWLFSEAAVGVSRSLLEEALAAFPPHYAELFDFKLTPERKARFVAGSLHQVQRLIVLVWRMLFERPAEKSSTRPALH